jgi:hypothetical protein
MRTLHQCLLDADIVRLRVIARFWDVELTADRQRDVAAELAEAMTTPEAVAYAWDTLPDDYRPVLEQLLAAGGQMPVRVFAREWGEIRAMGPGRMEREQPWQEPASLSEGLWYRGFFFRAFEQEPEGSGGTYEVAFVPAELQAHLPGPSSVQSAVVLEPIPEPAVVCSSGDALLDDACTLLAYLQTERLRPAADRSWPTRHETELARRLRDPNPARLVFLQHFVQQLGWLRVTDGGRLRPDPDPVTAWLRSSTEQQRRVLAQAWRDDPAWNDLFHVSTLRPEDTGAWRNDPLLTRKALLHHVEPCASGDWHGLDGFVAAVKQIAPDFQRPDGDYTTWYIRDAATDAYLSGFEHWDSVEGALIRYVMAGPLAWLGLTDVGATVPDGLPTAFRLTLAGMAFLGTEELLSGPAFAPLALRPDFTLSVPPARRYERFQLARVADWVCTGDPFVYRLTPSSLKRARQQGIPVTRVLEFLAEVTDEPVPRFVEAALTRWDARGAEARLERGVLLRISGEELMAQVKSSPATRNLIQEQVGPTAALVCERDWSRLIKALGEMGLLADVIGLEEHDAE